MTPKDKFNKVVDWIHDDILRARQAPGFIVGLSGTDSIVTFLAAFRALDRMDRAHRLMGVHFAPSEDFLADYPDAEKHTWFHTEIIPWLLTHNPLAHIEIDDSIDWRFDGLRWGKLADMSVIHMPARKMREPEWKYWVLGTRNRTEDELNNYSVASTIASVQPIVRLWKTDILDICEWLEVPQLVIDKSCEEDCICGREELRAKFSKELDWILSGSKERESLNPFLYKKLVKYIEDCRIKGNFKRHIPYEPQSS